MLDNNIDVEKDDLKPTPPYHRRPRQQSKVMPELKSVGVDLGFFKHAKPYQLAAVSGGVASLLSLTYYLVPAVAMGLWAAALPTIVIGGGAAGLAAGGKVAWEEIQKCRKNHGYKSPSP